MSWRESAISKGVTSPMRSSVPTATLVDCRSWRASWSRRIPRLSSEPRRRWRSPWRPQRVIPIVMTVVSDPIALGLSNSMSRPGWANITGFTTSGRRLAAKRLELLRELVPGLRKVAYLWTPGNPVNETWGEQVRMARDALEIELVSLPFTSSADIFAALAIAEKEQVNAVLIELNSLTARFSGVSLTNAWSETCPRCTLGLSRCAMVL